MINKEGTQIRGPVLVEWEDSRGHVEGWSDIEDMNDVEPCLIQSVGWVVQHTDRLLQVVPHIGNNQGTGGIIIPSKSVIAMEDLKVG